MGDTEMRDAPPRSVTPVPQSAAGLASSFLPAPPRPAQAGITIVYLLARLAFRLPPAHYKVLKDRYNAVHATRGELSGPEKAEMTQLIRQYAAAFLPEVLKEYKEGVPATAPPPPPPPPAPDALGGNAALAAGIDFEAERLAAAPRAVYAARPFPAAARDAWMAAQAQRLPRLLAASGTLGLPRGVSPGAAEALAAALVERLTAALEGIKAARDWRIGLGSAAGAAAAAEAVPESALRPAAVAGGGGSGGAAAQPVLCTTLRVAHPAMQPRARLWALNAREAAAAAVRERSAAAAAAAAAARRAAQGGPATPEEEAAAAAAARAAEAEAARAAAASAAAAARLALGRAAGDDVEARWAAQAAARAAEAAAANAALLAHAAGNGGAAASSSAAAAAAAAAAASSASFAMPSAPPASASGLGGAVVDRRVTLRDASTWLIRSDGRASPRLVAACDERMRRAEAPARGSGAGGGAEEAALDPLAPLLPPAPIRWY